MGGNLTCISRGGRGLACEVILLLLKPDCLPANAITIEFSVN